MTEPKEVEEVRTILEERLNPYFHEKGYGRLMFMDYEGSTGPEELGNLLDDLVEKADEGTKLSEPDTPAKDSFKEQTFSIKSALARICEMFGINIIGFTYSPWGFSDISIRIYFDPNTNQWGKGYDQEDKVGFLKDPFQSREKAISYVVEQVEQIPDIRKGFILEHGLNVKDGLLPGMKLDEWYSPAELKLLDRVGYQENN